MKKSGISIWITFLSLILLMKPCRAEDESLAKRSAQSVASLFSITIQDYFIASRWNRPGTANVVEFRTLIPFRIWEQNNLMRLSVPFRTESELGPGLSDVRIFDLLMFGSSKLNWGVGPVFNLGINKGPGIDTLQAGPVAALVFSPSQHWSLGLLNQNLFSEQFAVSTLQPILTYAINRTWTLSLGELPLVYDWKKDRFSVFSIGLQIGVLVSVSKQPVRFFLNPQFNTQENTRYYHWTIASGVTIPIGTIDHSS
jgi:hypothetical protein